MTYVNPAMLVKLTNRRDMTYVNSGMLVKLTNRRDMTYVNSGMLVKLTNRRDMTYSVLEPEWNQTNKNIFPYLASILP